MKKIFSLLFVFCILAISGCSCSKQGEYEFEYFIRDNQKYYCTDSQEADWELGPICTKYDEMEIFLSKDGKMTITSDDKIIEIGWYKIEDGKFLAKSVDSVEDVYVERGTYKRGILNMNMDGLQVVFEK